MSQIGSAKYLHKTFRNKNNNLSEITDFLRKICGKPSIYTQNNTG